MATFENKNNIPQQNNDLLNYYLTMNVNNICRICLEKGPKLMPIFDPVKPPHFSILIMACAAVQVLQGDGLPPYICQKCISKLNIAFQFKTQCESSDAKLRQCFEHFQNLQPAPDLSGFMMMKKEEQSATTEMAYNPNNDGGTTNSEDKQIESVNASQQIVGTTGIQILHTVQLEPNSSLYEIHKSALSGLKPDLTDLKPVTALKMESITTTTTSDENQQKESTVSTKKPMKQHQCDTCGKIFRTKPGLVHHIRIHTGERPYFCHLCEKRFINGGHLYTHMRIHTGEKNHVCAACSKAFATAQQLTKHTIAIHTSERPYGCTYCHKRFASSSNLNTHTKIHTGVKDYHCDQCAKAFSTKGQLYQHMLVHTGEKAYLCEYCQKRFSQKAHLVRHLKTHKN
nr:unnamed protein product [Callosobruchus chinensis]